MDPTEDLSARVLLKHILSTDPPRSPITRSSSRAQSTSATRRSSRLSNKDAGAQTPQGLLRRSLKHKIRESITRKSLPATKRRTASVVLRKTNTPAPASMLFDDGDTPRHILMNILRTEPVRSPVVHEKAASEEPQPSSANSSIASKRPSIELSGFDLPDITIGNAASTAKGLSRKRPRRSLNVTAFEKRLKDGDDVEEENEESVGDHSSLSLSSSTSLSLKTPFVDVRTEKRGLQRRASNRRVISEEEFGAAVNKWQMGGPSSFAQEECLNETTFSEGFTLGLSKLSEPDITTDILHCNTALYAQPDAMTSNFSIVATQDKPTVMASQLQRQMIEEEEQTEAEQSKPEKEKSMYLFPTEEGVVAEPLNEECFSRSVDNGTADVQPEDPEEAAAMSKVMSEEEEEENRVEAQTEEEEYQNEEKESADDSQTEEVEEGGVDSQPEEDVAARSQSEDEEVAADSQTEEDDEEGAVDSQTEAEGAAESQSEEDVAEYQDDPAAGLQSEEEDVGLADSQPEDEHDREPGEEDDEQASEQLPRDLEHISRRAHSSGGGVMPVIEAGRDLADTTDAGWSDGKSKAHSAIESSTKGQMGAFYTEAEPESDKEGSFHLSIDNLSNNLPEEAAAQGPAEQEEEWEDEENEEDEEESEEVPSKTPAFVREKRNMFHPDPLASPSVLKNVQTSSTSESLPAVKPKQVRKVRIGPAKRETGLPKSYLMGVFKHFAKTKVSADVYPVLKEIMDKFFERMAEDLETYAIHAKRKTIEVEDVELLLKRQGYVNDKVPVEVLIEKYLRMDQRKLLIPIATSGNVVIPKKRR
ncbi:centromere protein T [Morone saxatilis]|uniref:centromere protein T n=1 Tax=Morone saxatilis TaxID=34816 RepID=UPI0015E22784|nr:centromere protein T [Morone saxatilis]